MDSIRLGEHRIPVRIGGWRMDAGKRYSTACMRTMTSVMIPLHVDATRLDESRFDFRGLATLVDALAQGMADVLRSQAANWPELQCLYIDCMMTDHDGSDPGLYRFNSKIGEFVINCSFDAGAIAERELEAQAMDVFCAVVGRAEEAFLRRKKIALAQAMNALRGRVGPAFLEENCARMGTIRAQRGSGLEIRLLPREEDGRIRLLSPDLPGGKGELWLMLRTGTEHDPCVAEAVLDRVENFLCDDRSVHVDGRSFGESSCDISFEVRGVKEQADRLDAFLRQAFPGLDYVISDDFEVVCE